jgi:integration host factor subunit alpha
MVKSDLIKTIQTQVGVSPFTAKAVVDEVINQITTALANGDEVTLRGLGVFKTKRKNERMGRNPKTGEDAIITARKVVTFKASTLLASKVKDSNPS